MLTAFLTLVVASCVSALFLTLAYNLASWAYYGYLSFVETLSMFFFVIAGLGALSAGIVVAVLAIH